MKHRSDGNDRSLTAHEYLRHSMVFPLHPGRSAEGEGIAVPDTTTACRDVNGGNQFTSSVSSSRLRRKCCDSAIPSVTSIDAGGMIPRRYFNYGQK